MGAIPFKNIRLGISSDNEDVKELVAELEEGLNSFNKSSIYTRDIYDASDENHFTETLIKYLENDYKESRFSYKQQSSQGKKRAVDIGVHLKANSEHYLFCIEAKILPSRNYVTGMYAAIKRFKSCEHGLSNVNPAKARILHENAIVAYVKSGSFEKNQTIIDNKIHKLAQSRKQDEFGLNWTETEKLERKHFRRIAKLCSNHETIHGSNVCLFHFWLTIPSFK